MKVEVAVVIGIFLGVFHVVRGTDYDCHENEVIPVRECEALLRLYDSTNGDYWKLRNGWLSEWERDPCKWQGVSCYFGRVFSIELSENNLTGTLPVELTSFDALWKLDFSKNSLEGTIPEEFGQLENLEFLKLCDNRLDGSIPHTIGNMKSLQELYLSNNLLTGPIPEDVGRAAELVRLDLNSNRLSKSIPPSIGKLTGLHRLDLSNNTLNGTLPTELGNLELLRFLDLSNNAALSGRIPDSFPNMDYLRVFSFIGTELCVPTETIFETWMSERESISSNKNYCAAKLEMKMLLGMTLLLVLCPLLVIFAVKAVFSSKTQEVQDTFVGDIQTPEIRAKSADQDFDYFTFAEKRQVV